MSDTAALAALLASHPSEVEAVVAALCARGEAQHGVSDRTPTALVIAIWPDGDIEEQVDLARSILVALDNAGAISHAGTMYREFAERDRYNIARMGAAAWLRERVAHAPVSTNPLNLGAIRLCALASEGARVGAIYRAAFAIGGTFPRNAAEYRARLLEVERVSMGLPLPALDVDAEVAKVWGAGAPAKGEQR